MLLRLVVEAGEGHALVSATGELDVSTGGTLSNAVRDAFTDGYRVVLVDLAGVTFVDSSGVVSLDAGRRAAERHHARFGLVAPSQPVTRVLALLGLDDVIDVHPTLDAALHAS